GRACHRGFSMVDIDDGLAHGCAGGCPVSRGGEEPKKVLGMARRDIGPHARQGEEPQHVLGVPVDWYGPIDRVPIRSLRHPVRAYKRWTLRRRLGPYAPHDEDDPTSTG